MVGYEGILLHQVLSVLTEYGSIHLPAIKKVPKHLWFQHLLLTLDTNHLQFN